jgi:hypothetical protein
LMNFWENIGSKKIVVVKDLAGIGRNRTNTNIAKER